MVEMGFNAILMVFCQKNGF